MNNKDNFPIKPKALFLGPYSENQSEFRKIVDFLLNDIMQWRRNFHPNKERLISSGNKEEKDWKDTLNRLERELDILLGELKQSIPFHNPRYLGHMITDLTIPSLLGYMAGQLYNQNNVVGECSPITTEKELQFIKYLSEMFHYNAFEYFQENNEQNKIQSTGHLTCGGTTANIEALWVARNVKYFPISLKLLINEKKTSVRWNNIVKAIDDLKINIEDKEKKFSSFKGANGIKKLFNLPVTEVLNLFEKLKKAVSHLLIEKENCNSQNIKLYKTEYENEIKKFTIRELGVYRIHQLIKENFKLELELPYLVVPQSRHYSWEKAMDILGLGSRQIKYVKVDKEFKIDADDFKAKCKESQFVLMAVAVVGTTEEGVVDPISKINLKKSELENAGKGVWLHIDAAYGGYYASFFNKPLLKPDSKFNENFCKIDRLKSEFKILKNWLNKDILEDFKSIRKSDSITVDPHKMGYVPYSVGAVLYNDNRVKPFIEKKAPYLASSEDDSFDPSKLNLGSSSLEGSRSGAAALACYLSSKVIPNNLNGYGQLMAETFQNARALIDYMNSNNFAKENKNSSIQIQVQPLYDSLTNIVCYAVGVREIKLSPEEMNRLNERLYEEMSAEKNKLLNDYKFIVSKTELEYCNDNGDLIYAEHIDDFLNRFGVDFKRDDLKKTKYKLLLLRSALMNPMMTKESRKEIYNDYFIYLETLVNKILPELMLEKLFKKNKFERLKVLWIENQSRVEKLKHAILKGGVKSDIDISRFLDIEFVTNLSSSSTLVEYSNINDKKVAREKYNIFIVDLNLSDSEHKEWSSGIEVIKKIKNDCGNPIILVYSQFLNPDFRIEEEDDTSDKKIKNIRHNEIIENYLKHYFQLTNDNFVSKSLNMNNKFIPEENPVELNDLNLLTMKLAKLVFNKIGKIA